jgi:hypothetical protein
MLRHVQVLILRDGVHSQIGWRTILKTPSVRSEFEEIGFGNGVKSVPRAATPATMNATPLPSRQTDPKVMMESPKIGTTPRAMHASTMEAIVGDNNGWRFE